MDHRIAEATSAAVQWYNLGPSRSAKRSLFSFGRSRRPEPVVYQEVISAEPVVDDWHHGRGDWNVSTAPQFNRSLSLHVKSSRNDRRSCNIDSLSDSSNFQQTQTNVRLRTLYDLGPLFRRSAID